MATGDKLVTLNGLKAAWDASKAAFVDAENIAKAFDANTNYKTGEYVLRDAVLYRFTADHLAGAWTGTDAEAVVLSSDLAEKTDVLDNRVDGAAIIDAESEKVYHFQDTYPTQVKVKNYNIGTPIKFDYYDGKSVRKHGSSIVETGGILFEVDENGVITANGTCTSNTFYKIWDNRNRVKFPFDAETITMSFVAYPKAAYYYLNYGSSADEQRINGRYGSTTFTTKNRSDYTYLNGGVYLLAGTYTNQKIFPVIEMGSTSHHHVFYGNNKNLMNLDYTDSGEDNGITWTVDHEAGTVTLNGTCTAQFEIHIEVRGTLRKPVKEGDIVKASGTPGANPNYKDVSVYFNLKDENNTTLLAVRDYYGSATPITVSDYYGISSGIQIKRGAVCNNMVIRPQLEVGQRATEFVVNKMNFYAPMMGGALMTYEGDTTICAVPEMTSDIEVQMDTEAYIAEKLNLPTKINLCTYNVGLWNYGDRTNRGYDPTDTSHPAYEYSTEPTADKVIALKQEIAKHDIDILCLQEFNIDFSRDSEVVATRDILNPVFFDQFKGHNEERVYSRYRFLDAIKMKVGQVVQRGYIALRVQVTGKSVLLVNTHLSYNDAESRASQITDIAELVANEPYAIICGDFNVDDLSELDPITADAPTGLGFKMANGGYFGTIATIKTSNRNYDNVLVSPSLIIANVERLDSDQHLPSDHYPVLAQIIVPPTRYPGEIDIYEDEGE